MKHITYPDTNECRHALKHMKEGSCIINSTSVNAYNGNPEALDYTATKGAIVAFTRGLSQQLASRGIRVNGVAPGPVWTPIQPASKPAEMIQNLGCEVPMNRVAQPCEIAPCYLFLATCQDSSYFTGQVLHPNGIPLYAFYINNSVQLCLHIFGLACRWDGRQRLSYSVPSPISY